MNIMSDAAHNSLDDPLQEEQAEKSKLPIILVLLASLIVIVFLTGFILLKGGNANGVLEVPEKKLSGYQLKFKEPFTTNLSPPSSDDLISVYVTLELLPRNGFSKSQMLEELGIETESNEDRMAAVMEIISEALASKTKEEVKSSEGRDQVRRFILNKVNDELFYGEVKQVYLHNQTVH